MKDSCGEVEEEKKLGIKLTTERLKRNQGRRGEETHLLVHVQLAEDLGRIQKVLVVVNPGKARRNRKQNVSLVCDHGEEIDLASRGNDVLLRIECQERQVENNRKPVAIDHKEEGQESVNGSLGNDVGVQTVAKVDRVDVVTATEKGEIEISMDLPRHVNGTQMPGLGAISYHSRSLYIIVKKT